jgi:serine/threonine protein kinase
MAIDSKRVKEIFLEAAELPDEAARAAYLDKACGADAGVRERVEALLRSHDPEGSFLGTPAAAVPDSASGATEALTGNPDLGEQATRTAGAENASSPDEALAFLAPPNRPDALGRLGHYEVLQVLGRGGFGIVFRAFDEMLQRVVALKVMAPQLAATSPARKRFLREARSSARVRHENVVHVYEVAEQPLPYLAMEFIPGETLQQRLDRVGPLDVPETLRIGRQIAEGLAAAHATDLIHRDIKPGNVLLEGGQRKVKITDFGLARAADDASISQSGIIAGTPMYMSPEQALGQTLDQRADLFSLGSVLYQMVAGRPPFRANGTLAVLKRVAEDKPRAIREIIPETPQWLCDIIAKLHAKNPDDRYQSAREVADVLADCEAQLKANARLKDFSRIPRSTPRQSGRQKWAILAAAVTVFLPVVVLAMTEFTGMTHLFLDRQAKFDANKTGGEPPDLVVAKKETPVLVPKQELLLPTYKNSIGMEFVIVPKGKSWLGGSKGNVGYDEVVIPADFYLGKYEVTQEEWEKVMRENPSSFSRKGDKKDVVKNITDAELKRFPVEMVSWGQCQLFVAKLNQLEKETGWIYRLPTAVQWEYACRGGPMSNQLDSAFDYYFAKPTNTFLPENANFNNGLNRTCNVGSYEPNALGLYDMHGNVWEWCLDKLPTGQSRRRGGGWSDALTEKKGSQSLGAGFNWYTPAERQYDHVGLRLARVPADFPSPEGKSPPQNLQPTTLVTAVSLAVSLAEADILKRLEFKGTITTNGPCTVTYIFLRSDSAHGPTFTLNFDKAGVKEVSTEWHYGPGSKGKRWEVLKVLTPNEMLSEKAEFNFDLAKGRDILAEQQVAPFTDADVQRIAALPAAQQVEEVRKELKRRNPGFDGQVDHKIEGGVVAALRIVTDKVTDIAPIRAWTALRELECSGTWTGKPNGRLADLTPLEGMNLASLTHLGLNDTKVSDADRIYFKDCKVLRYLNLCSTRVTDIGLMHFKDCKALTTVRLAGTIARDAGLANFKGMPLRDLWIFDTGITDLTPLQGMPLESIGLTPKNITRGLDILRDMKSLKTVGISRDQGWPAAEFWERYHKGEFK